MPDQTAHIAGFRTTPYQYRLEGNIFNLWLADSFTINAPVFVKNSKDFFMLTQDKLMLKMEEGPGEGIEPEIVLTTVSIAPSASSENQSPFPEGYIRMDDTELRKIQDSLLREFMRVDSALTVTAEASHTVTPPPPTKKPVRATEKGKKANTTKGRRNINSRKTV